jgi:hypothetical protein
MIMMYFPKAFAKAVSLRIHDVSPDVKIQMNMSCERIF